MRSEKANEKLWTPLESKVQTVRPLRKHGSVSVGPTVAGRGEGKKEKDRQTIFFEAVQRGVRKFWMHVPS